MRTLTRAKHILVERLEHGFARTLCGRIIPYLGVIFGRYPDPEYFRHNHPDCQDCLRKHFPAQKSDS